MTGAVVSITVIVWLALLVLLQASVAIQVRVSVKLPAHEPSARISLKLMAGLLSQLSVAAGEPALGTASH
jgi:hypothetical protein